MRTQFFSDSAAGFWKAASGSNALLAVVLLLNLFGFFVQSSIGSKTYIAGCQRVRGESETEEEFRRRHVTYVSFSDATIE